MTWADQVAPATMDWPCGGEAHVIRWQAGSVELPSHDDAEAELALGALGGAVPACFALRAVWQAYAGDPVLVTLGRRPGEASIGLGADGVPASARGGGARRDALLLLFSLPPPFIDRLVLGAMAAAAARWEDEGFRDLHGLRLGAALAARATPALRRLGAELTGPDEEVSVHCTPAPIGSGASVRAERTLAGLEVMASLPLSWLADVWGPGLSEPGGRMVLAVHDRPAPAGAVHVETARWGPQRRGVAAESWEAASVPAVAHRDGDGAWHVRDA